MSLILCDSLHVILYDTDYVLILLSYTISAHPLHGEALYICTTFSGTMKAAFEAVKGHQTWVARFIRREPGVYELASFLPHVKSS